MPVRADRCPHCLAALSSEVGLSCPHCRRSLLPAGRKARRAAEQEHLARAQRAQNAAPQPSHPHQPHPPAWATPTPPPPIPPPPGAPSEAPASGWAPPIPAPPGAVGGPRPVLTALLVIVSVLGLVGGVYVALRSIGTKVSQSATLAGAVETEPPIYAGPTFSVRLPAPVKVETIEDGRLTLTMYGHETRDGVVAVGVVNIPPGNAVDLDAAAEGFALKGGGRIVSETPAEVDGRPARDVVISGVEGPELGTGWIRIIVDGSRLYEIMAMQAGDHTEPPAAYRMARDSFVMR